MRLFEQNSSDILILHNDKYRDPLSIRNEMTTHTASLPLRIYMILRCWKEINCDFISPKQTAYKASLEANKGPI